MDKAQLKFRDAPSIEISVLWGRHAAAVRQWPGTLAKKKMPKVMN